MNYNVIENDEYVMGFANDVALFFKKEVVDYYVNEVCLDDIDTQHTDNMLKTNARLRELSDSDNKYYVKVTLGYSYTIEIYKLVLALTEFY